MNGTHNSEAPEGDATGERYHEKVEAIADLCSWHVDLEQGETEWSWTVRDMFEISTTDSLVDHEDVLEFVATEHEAFVEHERTAVFDGEPFEIEYQIEVDGSKKWIRERADIRRDSEGEPIAAIGVLQDITDHKDREQDLELFRNLVDNASDAFFVVDPETSAIVDVNEAACRLLGYDREELLSLSVPDINPAFAEETWDGFVETLRENGAETVEAEHRRKDGSTFPVEVHVSYVSLDQDYHVATVRDISERKAREQQLEAARKRYQTLIDAAPDPIFVADADTGELVEANAAAAELRGQPRDELVGRNQTDLHPEEETDRYRELFEYHVDHSGTIKEFDDGTPVYLTTVDGERIPVAIRTATVSLSDRTLVHGIFRDISEQHRYENALTGINTAAQDLLHAETGAEIAEIVVDTATDVLDASESGVYLYDDHRGELVPAAYSEGLDEMLKEIPRFSPGESIAWRVFADQEQARFDDVRTTDDVYDSGTPIRSELLVPLGEHGVFLVGDTATAAFDDMTEEIAETLASTAESALDHADRAQALRKQERESQLQAELLERVNRLNDEIRTILQALLQTHSHGAITQQVCESLVSLDRFSYAWIGEPDPGENEIEISARAGSPKQYLDTISLDLDAENTLPASRAARERTTISEPRIAADPHRSDWWNTALAYEFRSVISVPLVYNEFLYGVMTIYSDRPGGFDDTTRSVLTELGELVGYALNASEQRNALLGVGAAEVTFDITDSNDIFAEFAAQLETEIRIVNITPRSEDAYLVHFVCEDADVDRIRSAVEDRPSMTELRAISETDPTVYETIVIGGCLVTTLATVGANVRSVVVSDTHCRITASIPENREKGTLIGRLKEEYPDIDVAIQQRGTASPSISGMGLITDAVTDRQQDLLATAYYSGFFDRQRKRTGAEIADSLGISQPAFSTQLRAAQRNLLAVILEDRPQA